jgi:hypothetical protein
MKEGATKLGFKTSIIALFVAIVLFIGLTLVYLSFSRITAVTNSAASKFIDKVAELSADHIGFQFKRGNGRAVSDALVATAWRPAAIAWQPGSRNASRPLASREFSVG